MRFGEDYDEDSIPFRTIINDMVHDHINQTYLNQFNRRHPWWLI
jgi:hypothetical protein